MKNQNKYYNILYTAGALLLLLGFILNFIHLIFAPYMVLCGAILFACGQMACGYKGENIVIKRLRRQQIMGSILLVTTGVMMLCLHHNEWIACLAIASFLELYTAFRIPQEEEKEQSKK